jgi:hypothetical protein
METKPLVLLVGVYDSKADADADCEDAKALNRNSFFGIFDAAVITKDDNGTIHVNKDEKTTRQGATASTGSGSRSNATTRCSGRDRPDPSCCMPAHPTTSSPPPSTGRIGGTAIEIDLTTPVARWTSDGTDQGDHAAHGPRHPAGTRGTPPAAVTNRAAQATLMMTGSWELQVSIDAPDGVDNLILPPSVTG